MAVIVVRVQGGVNELLHEGSLDSQIGPVFGDRTDLLELALKCQIGPVAEDRTDRVVLTRCDGIKPLGSVAGSQISNKALVIYGTKL